MAQREIVKWLTVKRARNADYYSVNDVADSLGIAWRSCNRQLKQLYAYGFLDRKVSFGGPPAYRLRKDKILLKYVEEEVQK